MANASNVCSKLGISGVVYSTSSDQSLRQLLMVQSQVTWIIYVGTSITLINRTTFNMISCAQFTTALQIARSVSLNLLQVRVGLLAPSRSNF